MSLPIPEHAYRTYSIGECDCCGAGPRRLHFVVAYGTDTYACDSCAGVDPADYDEDGCLCPDAWCPLHGGRELEDRA